MTETVQTVQRFTFADISTRDVLFQYCFYSPLSHEFALAPEQISEKLWHMLGSYHHDQNI